MRRIFNIFSLFINRNIYYNLIHNKPLEQSNDSFEGLVFMLKEAGFRFNCLMADELTEDGSCKRRILEQVFFIINAQIVYSKYFITD